MIAVVLVGGRGTRLRPLTDTIPKPLLPIVDRPLLEWVLGGLGRHGIDEAVLSLGYRPDAFRDAYPDGTCAGVRLRYAVEPEPLDTAGAVRFAATVAGVDGRFVVVNGDVLTDFDLTALVRFHEDAGGEATIALHRVDDPSAFGVVPTDDRGRVVAFVEKPSRDEAPTDLINAGTYVLEPGVLGRIPPDRPVSIEREVFPAMAADSVLYAAPDGGAYWLDTGTPGDYIQAQQDALEGCLGEVPRAIHPDAAIDPGAEIHRSVVGAGAVVAAHCVVEASVVMPRATIEADAAVRFSIVGPGARVGRAASVLGMTVVGAHASVADGESLTGARVPEPV